MKYEYLNCYLYYFKFGSGSQPSIALGFIQDKAEIQNKRGFSQIDYLYDNDLKGLAKPF